MMPLVAQIGDTVRTLTEVREMAEVKVEWKIRRFFSLSSKVDDYYESPSFHFEGLVWHLRLYPNNETEHVGIYLYREDLSPRKTINYTFGIKCADRVEERDEQEDKFLAPHYDVGGCDDFWSRSELRNQAPRLMPGNILTITCHLKCSEPMDTTKISSRSLGVISSSLRVWEVSRNMKRVLTDGKWSDFILKLGDREWPVHKVILDSRCEYFKNMFRHGWAENTMGELTFEDMEEDTLANVLNFIYTGCVEDMSVGNVCEIYDAAQKFLLDDLKALCIEYMKEEMCLEIFCKVLVIADMYNEEDLRQSAIEFFMLEEDQIFDYEEWKELKKYHGSVAADLLEEIRKKEKHF